MVAITATRPAISGDLAVTLSEGALDFEALGGQRVPALAAHHGACMSMLSRASCTLKDVADLVCEDPGLALAVLCDVNAGRDPERARLLSIEASVNLLGQERLRTVLNRVPVLEELVSGDALRRALGLWERQRLAGCLVEHWALLREDKSPSECRIAALCSGFAEMLVCVYAPQRHLQVLQLQSGRCAEAASGAALGRSYNAFGRDLVEAWKLPELIEDALAGERFEFYRPLGVMLANELARQADSGWYTPGVVACEEALADYLGLSFGRCCALVHQVALRAARAAKAPGIDRAAAALVNLPGPVEIPGLETRAPAPRQPAETSQVAAEASTAVTSGTGPTHEGAPNTAAVTLDDERLHALLLRTKQRFRGVSASKIIAALLEALHQELGMRHAILFLLEAGGGEMLRARIAHGLAPDAPLATLEVPLGESRLLQGLMRKPQSILINPDNLARYRRHLPADLLAHAERVPAFACMSLFAGARPLGLVYVDPGEGGGLDARAYGCFKSLCALGNQALRRPAPAKRPAPAARSGTG